MDAVEYEKAIAAHTARAMSLGIRILQMHRLGRTDVEHVAVMLANMRPPTGAVVVDVGCGIGEVAKLMHEQRPDLSFVLTNNSRSQLALCPPTMPQLLGDMHSIDLETGFADVVMANFTVGFGVLEDAFSEFDRILKPDGILFIADVMGPDETLLRRTGYDAPSPRDLAAVARERGYGFSAKILNGPADSFTALADDDETRMIPGRLRTGHWRFVRG